MTPPPCHKFDTAVARFDAVHAIAPDGLAAGYHARLSFWVTELHQGEPSEALRLAAHCQHIRRWALPRSDFPAGKVGYKKWRTTLAQKHADEARTILASLDFAPHTIDRVETFLLKRGLKTDSDVQLFEDAICLTFIERQFASFSQKYDDEKTIRVLQKTWKKMSPRGHAAATSLANTLDEPSRKLIERALA